MPSTRSSARIAGKGASQEDVSTASAGTKRKTETGSSPAAKKGKKSSGKEQKSIEETLPVQSKDTESKEEDEDADEGKAEAETEQPSESKPETSGDANENGDVAMKDKDAPEKEQATEEPTQKEEEKEDKTQAEEEKEEPPATANGDSAVEPEGREEAVPSNILEKGIIYFFFRGRVGIDDPKDVNDIARSYIILRPMNTEDKLTEGPIGDTGNNRLIAIPKKVLPLSGKDRWISFVEKAKTSFQTLKDEFLSASDYMTKTAGARHAPAATPVGEGVYAITSTGRESHLAYMLTLPQELGEVQKEIGLKDKGSFIISTKNPDAPAPGNAQLPKAAEYPQEIKDEFGSLRWTATNPKHLDYVNTTFLLVGESSGLDKAVQPEGQDEKEGKETPLEEMEKLEDEDTHRMEDLKGDASAAIFADLEAHAKDYPTLQTSF